MSPRKHAAIVWIFLLAASGVAFAQVDARDLYDRALELYRAEAFAEALPLFQEFIAASPQDTKADDAQWYLGRAFLKLGRIDEAVQAFEAVRGHEGGSNRVVEATIDLAKIRLDRGDLDAALALLEPLKKPQDLAPEDRRALRLLANVRLELGARDWKAYRDQEARYHLGEAVAEYEFLLREPRDDKERLSLLEDLGKIYLQLMETGRDAPAARVYQEAAIGAFGQALDLNPEEPKKVKLLGLLESARQPERVALTGTVEALGGAANAASERPTASSVWVPGAQASAEFSLAIPLTFQQQLVVSAGFAHDSFALRTFNFGPTELDAERLLQSTEDFNAGLAWRTGSRHGLRSELKASGGYRLAEDSELSNWGLGVTEKLDWRVAPSWKLGLDGSWAISRYPAYATGSLRELDHWLTGINPQFTWYPSPDLSLGLGYDFTFKQYLNAKYDTLAGIGTATENRQYFTHTADLTLRATPGKVVHPTLTYSFTYNETRNYDVEVQILVTQPFVRDYYDYIENALDLGLLCKWSKDFSTDLKAKAALQNFLNYPAQDAAGDNLTGEKRRDLNIILGGELKCRIWKKEKNRLGDLSADLRAVYEQNISNTYHESSFQTNYRTLAITGGLVLELK